MAYICQYGMVGFASSFVERLYRSVTATNNERRCVFLAVMVAAVPTFVCLNSESILLRDVTHFDETTIMEISEYSKLLIPSSSRSRISIAYS